MCFWKTNLRISGDGDNRTARPVPGQEMCCPGMNNHEVNVHKKYQVILGDVEKVVFVER